MAEEEKIDLIIEAVNQTKQEIAAARAEIKGLKEEQTGLTESTNKQDAANKKAKTGFGKLNESVGKARIGMQQFQKVVATSAALIQGARDVYAIIKANNDLSASLKQQDAALIAANSRIGSYRESAKRAAREMLVAGTASKAMVDQFMEAADRIHSSDSFRVLAQDIMRVRKEAENPFFDNLVEANKFAKANPEGPRPRLAGNIAQTQLGLEAQYVTTQVVVDQQSLEFGEITLDQFYANGVKNREKYNELEITATRSMYAAMLDAANLTAAERKAIAMEESAALQTIHLRQVADEIQAEQEKENAKRAIREAGLAGAQDMFANLATVAESFGKEGFAAFKAFSTAQAVVATYTSAVSAYNSMVGIPYVGPVLAVAAAAAAIAAGVANIAKIQSAQPAGYAEGGLIPGAPSSTDNRMAMVATGEFIIPAKVVKEWGAAHFEAYRRGHAAGMPRGSSALGFAAGGLVGPAGAGVGSMSVSVGIINTRDEMRRFQEKEGSRIVIDQMRRRSNAVRL